MFALFVPCSLMALATAAASRFSKPWEDLRQSSLAGVLLQQCQQEQQLLSKFARTLVV
jgi:hypothetical protein